MQIYNFTNLPTKQNINCNKREKNNSFCLRNDYSQNPINPKYYQALNGIAFKGNSSNYEINQEKTLEHLIFNRIFLILTGEAKEDADFLSDIITFSNSSYDDKSKLEKDDDIRNSLLNALSDNTSGSFIKNVLNGIKDESVKLELASHLQETLHSNKGNELLQIKKEAIDYTKKIMIMSKTENDYDLNDFDRKLSILRMIDKINYNYRRIDTNKDYFYEVLSCSTKKDGKIDLDYMENLSRILLDSGYIEPFVIEFSDFLTEKIENFPQQKDLIFNNIFKLFKTQSFDLETAKEIFSNSFDNKGFSQKRFDIIIDIIHSTCFDEIDRTGEKIDEVIDTQKVHFDDLLISLINNFFTEVVDKNENTAINSECIDNFILKELDKYL